MSAKELEGLIGRTANVKLYKDDYTVECVIEDAREAFGRREVLVAPRAGEGRKWVTVGKTDLEVGT